MTPQGQFAPQPQQQGWFSKNWKWLVGGGCLTALLCCGVFSAAAMFLSPEGTTKFELGGGGSLRVDCGTPGPGGVDCDVKRTSGDGALKGCWDLEITCANNSKMVGHACGSLAAGVPSGVTNMPVAAFSNQDKCDEPRSGVVKNLEVTNE